MYALSPLYIQVLTLNRSVTADVISEDERDRLTLQDLELEHRASLISLVEAERQYQESSLNAPVGSLQETFHTDDNNCVSLLALIGNDDLVVSAQNEIDFIRSSLARDSIFDNNILQEQLFRHSQRISTMLAEDQDRLSHLRHCRRRQWQSHIPWYGPHPK